MQNDEEKVDARLVKEMFNSIRSKEIINIKTQKYIDRKMVENITSYISVKLEKEGKNNEV
jgi:hypothetical protein